MNDPEKNYHEVPATERMTYFPLIRNYYILNIGTKLTMIFRYWSEFSGGGRWGEVMKLYVFFLF